MRCNFTFIALHLMTVFVGSLLDESEYINCTGICCLKQCAVELTRHPLSSIGHYMLHVLQLFMLPDLNVLQVGQTAFRGTKKLNLIQSVVFDAAYNSNENLLICAPTGAGKTNIAMLAVLRELKQHITEGVIKTDEFKVMSSFCYCVILEFLICVMI